MSKFGPGHLRLLARCCGVGALGLAGGCIAGAGYAISTPENYLVHHKLRIANTKSNELSELVDRDYYLRAKRDLISKHLFPAEENRQATLLLISGPPGCGRHAAIASAFSTTDANMKVLEVNASSPIVTDVTNQISKGLHEKLFLPIAMLAVYMMETNFWRNKYLVDESDAFKIISNAIDVCGCNSVLLNSFSGRSPNNLADWAHDLVSSGHVSVVIDSQDQALAGEELLFASKNPSESELKLESVPFVHIMIENPSMQNRELEDGIDPVSNRIEAIFETNQELGVELILDIVSPLTGLRLFPLIRVAEKKPKTVAELEIACQEIINEEAEKIKAKLLLTEDVDESSLDGRTMDLIIWTWSILEVLAGARIRIGNFQDSSNQLKQIPLPSLPASVSMDNQIGIAGAEIRRLSFHFLESRGKPVPWSSFPPSDEENVSTNQRMISVPPLTINAFKELQYDLDLLDRVDARRKVVHHKEDVSFLKIDIADYMERRESYERSVKYFYEYVNEKGNEMDPTQLINGKIEIDRLGNMLDNEMAVLESRKEAILFSN